MKLHHWFFQLMLPLVWSTVSLLHFHQPGDEYGLWAVSSMAGSWVLFLVPNIGDIGDGWVRATVAMVGFLVMGGVGLLLCWLKASVRVWLVLWLVSSLVSMGLMLMQYPSIERAIAKNGSWAAYIYAAILMSAYSATMLTLIGGGIKRFLTQHQPE